TLRMANAALRADCRPGPQQGLLLYVLDMLRTGQAPAKLVLQQPAEIRDEMGLRRRVLGPQFVKVPFSELMKFRGWCRAHLSNPSMTALARWSAVGARSSLAHPDSSAYCIAWALATWKCQPFAFYLRRAAVGFSFQHF